MYEIHTMNGCILVFYEEENLKKSTVNLIFPLTR